MRTHRRLAGLRSVNLGVIAAAGMATVASSPQVASAELAYGLTTAGNIVTFDTSNPAIIAGTSAAISGTTGGEAIVDIDVYPVNHILHGIGGTTGNIYRINPVTGVATLDAAPQSSVGTPETIDFNPSADRLRVFSAGDANFRITPSVGSAGSNGANIGLVTADGTLAYSGGSPPNPNLQAAAYTNNFDGTATTALYSIDVDADTLVLHSGAPAFSTLGTVGALGVNVGSNVGFDISPAGANFVTDGNSLYSINLTSGLLSPLGTIATAGTLQSLAVVPEPATVALAALGFVPALRRRR